MTIEELKLLKESEDKVEFKRAENVKMADFAEVFIKDLTRARVKYLVDKLTGVILDKHGSGSGTYYNLKKAVKTFEGVLSLVSK